MKKVTTIGDIKENVQFLDTAVLRWLNANPPDRLQQVLREAHGKLEQCSKMCDAPLRVSLVGEEESNTPLMLGALLDTTEVFPGMLQKSLENILEVRIAPKSEEKPIRVKGATVVFLDEAAVWNVMNGFLQDLAGKGLAGTLPKNVSSSDELPKVEDALVSLYPKAKDPSSQYTILSALEYVLAIKHNQNVVLREQRHTCTVAKEIVGCALNSSGRPEMSEGVEAFHQAIEQMHEEVGGFNTNATPTDKDLHAMFPLIHKLIIDVEAWGVPFGIENPRTAAGISLVVFPEHLDKINARHRVLCMNELRESHTMLAVLNGAGGNAGKAASLISQLGKGMAEKTIPVVARFDEFQPAPSETPQSYYSQGFSGLLNQAKSLAGANKPIYLCSATCYLMDAKAKRSNWNFGKNDWFADSKRQAAYSVYKRGEADVKKLLAQLEADRKALPDFVQMKQALQRYSDGAGMATMRQDAIIFARDKGERLLKDEILKEFRAAYRMVDEIGPSLETGEQVAMVSSDVTYRAQEFYRVLELAVADALPSGTSDYRKLKVKETEQEMLLWDITETEITSQVASWPEWFAILNQSMVKKTSTPATATAAQKPQKVFSRYDKIKKAGGEVPSEFKAFNDRFIKTAEAMSEFALKKIAEAVLYSVQRFETHADYQAAIQSLQGILNVDKLSEMEEGLPILDAWQPTRMVEDALVPEVLERISDEVDDLKNIRYPYDVEKPCFWNLALVIRVQVQLVKTLRDKVSRLIAAAENEFYSFFASEVLRAEILPLVRSCLNDTNFLAQVARDEAVPQAQAEKNEADTTGQSVRTMLENIKQALSLGGPSSAAPTAKPVGAAPTAKPVGAAPTAKPVGTAPAAKPSAAKSATPSPDQATALEGKEEGSDEW